MLRAPFGLATLFLNATRNLFGNDKEALPPGEVLLLIANPLAHGARLASATQRSIHSRSVVTVADARFADPSLKIDYSFPGISSRSLKAATTFGRLFEGLRLRRSVPRTHQLIGSQNHFYREYLFLAQALRFIEAREIVSRLAPETVLVTDYDRHTYNWPWISAANERGLSTASLVHGSPNDSNYVPVLARNVLVWGQAQLSWFAERSPDARAIVVGRPDLSNWTADAPQRLRRVVVCHSREILSLTEVERITASVAAFQRRGLEVHLRLHPSMVEEGLDSNWARISRMASSVSGGRESFAESISASDVVVCVTSTSAIDAITKGVLTLVLCDDDRVLPCDLGEVRRNAPSVLDAIEKRLAGSLAGTSVPRELVDHLIASRGPDAEALLDSAVASL
ncbi:hypothetical protein [Microterricola gilva]|uniref:hypothetical protein n=1 Tax=Microterricola gilva TaxID=393267 RepID=UPI00102C22D2|nr:hypothetical protein [Microterricola gilva]